MSPTPSSLRRVLVALLVALGVALGPAACGGPAPAGVDLRVGTAAGTWTLAGLARTALSPALAARRDALLAEVPWQPLGGASEDRPEAPRLLVHGDRVLNDELLAAGLALGHVPVTTASGAPLDPNAAAARLALVRAAREARAGLWGEVPAPRPWAFPMAGVALPLHHKDPRADYDRELDELVALGARWVNLVVATRQADVGATEVPLESDRTPPDARIVATIRAARERGLGVQLMPIVLLVDAGPDDWRGTLDPTDRGAWWRSYARFLGHMADLAREGGADVLCIGSELCSMEADEDAWRRLAADLRLRFAGALTYSANWDHYATVPFWDALDLAQMTGYFEVCRQTSFGGPGDRYATREACLRAGWRGARAELRRLEVVSGLPSVFSEVGVPSVEGALAQPWNYTLDGAADPEAQRAAFATFREVFTPGGEPRLDGLFLYDYWGEGGPDDRTYTARGKPALEEWRALLADLAAAAEEPDR